jgi:hypothetical protein
MHENPPIYSLLITIVKKVDGDDVEADKTEFIRFDLTSRNKSLDNFMKMTNLGHQTHIHNIIIE